MTAPRYKVGDRVTVQGEPGVRTVERIGGLDIEYVDENALSPEDRAVIEAPVYFLAERPGAVPEAALSPAEHPMDELHHQVGEGLALAASAITALDCPLRRMSARWEDRNHDSNCLWCRAHTAGMEAAAQIMEEMAKRYHADLMPLDPDAAVREIRRQARGGEGGE